MSRRVGLTFLWGFGRFISSHYYWHIFWFAIALIHHSNGGSVNFQEHCSKN